MVFILGKYIEIEIGIEKHCAGNAFDSDFDPECDPDRAVQG